MAISQKMIQFAEKSSWIRKMFEEGAKMKAIYGADNVFDFSLGNPDAPPPEKFDKVLQNLVNNVTPGMHGYMSNVGYQWVREAIAKTLSDEQNIIIPGENLVMTVGAAGGLNVVLKALLDPGDEVIVLAPYFVDYGFYIDNHGGTIRIVQTDAAFNPDLQAIEAAITSKTKAILINSPNNPTGQVYSAQILANLGTVLKNASEKFGTTVYLLADEPYRKIAYDGIVVPSIFAAYANSILVSSYSKDLSLPGERIGYIAVHPELTPKNDLMKALTLANRILGFINAPALMQQAVAQMQHTSVDIALYEKRKQLICGVLERAGFEFTPPKGTFYAFPKAPIADDVQFVSMLQEEKVLAVPGRGFGSPGYIRFAFCVPEEVIIKAEPGIVRAMERARKLQ